MKNKTNWCSGTTDKFEIYQALVSLYNSNRSGHIAIVNNNYDNLYYPVTKTEDKLTVFDYQATWVGSNSKLPEINTIEWDLYFNYIPCFSTSEARENYIKDGTLHEDLNFGIGIQTPVKRKDLEKLFPDKNFKSLDWSWYKNKPIKIIDNTIKECYCIIMEDKVLDKRKVLELLKEGLDFLENNNLNN